MGACSWCLTARQVRCFSENGRRSNRATLLECPVTALSCDSHSMEPVSHSKMSSRKITWYSSPATEPISWGLCVLMCAYARTAVPSQVPGRWMGNITVYPVITAAHPCKLSLCLLFRDKKWAHYYPFVYLWMYIPIQDMHIQHLALFIICLRTFRINLGKCSKNDHLIRIKRLGFSVQVYYCSICIYMYKYK